MHPHDLRHTTASLAISSGANVKAVQRMLGHASVAMTLDTYADLFDDDLDAVAARLNAQMPLVALPAGPQTRYGRPKRTHSRVLAGPNDREHASAGMIWGDRSVRPSLLNLTNDLDTARWRSPTR